MKLDSAQLFSWLPLRMLYAASVRASDCMEDALCGRQPPTGGEICKEQC